MKEASHQKLKTNMYRSCNYDNSSTDSQFTETDEDITFLEACMDCDEDALYDIIQDGLTWEQVNERDKSGRTGLSHACGNGFMPILELLAQVEEVDANLPDNEGNTPLIFAAQAGHSDVLNFVINHFRKVRVDQSNHLGFTALMKAAIQGRTRCAKLLLFAGANPNKRDNGRGLCAEEWARFTGRQTCADAISKYVHSKKYFFKKTFFFSRDRWNSEPDLTVSSPAEDKSEKNWFKKRLSLRRKRSKGEECGASMSAPLVQAARCGSAPLLATSPTTSPTTSRKSFRRPSCIDGVVPLNIIPKLKKNSFKHNICDLKEEICPPNPPAILETDFDAEKLLKEALIQEEMEEDDGLV